MRDSVVAKSSGRRLSKRGVVRGFCAFRPAQGTCVGIITVPVLGRMTSADEVTEEVA